MIGLGVLELSMLMISDAESAEPVAGTASHGTRPRGFPV
jgi:hypothetical protein